MCRLSIFRLVECNVVVAFEVVSTLETIEMHTHTRESYRVRTSTAGGPTCLNLMRRALVNKCARATQITSTEAPHMYTSAHKQLPAFTSPYAHSDLTAKGQLLSLHMREHCRTLAPDGRRASDQPTVLSDSSSIRAFLAALSSAVIFLFFFLPDFWSPLLPGVASPRCAWLSASSLLVSSLSVLSSVLSSVSSVLSWSLSLKRGPLTNSWHSGASGPPVSASRA
mmetsp:Transcript_21682/g.53157  ORF Transcript_21682/g.53157 Transcript_21682/m.53157 type:complete len:224 (-) Transcript_21682:619-1290(-)